MRKKIFIASDHAGFELKEALAPFLRERGYEVEDAGPASFDPGDDYPDYMHALARAVISHPGSFGVAACKSGQGEGMALNRHVGIRAAVYAGGSLELVRLSRLDNDANVLALAAAFITVEEAKVAVLEWLRTAFSGEERHVRRIARLDP